jgi:hypothetical protein
MMRRLFTIAVLAAIPASAAAQRFGAAPHFASHTSPLFAHSRGNFAASYYPLPLFDPLYSDYLYSTGYPVASQPPVIVMQAPPPAATPDRAVLPTQPLLIELQGGRYIQLSGDKDSRTQMLDDESASTVLRKPAVVESVARLPRETTHAVLVFRDGSREEVSNYTIADGVLYAGADYYTAGSWNRKIELSSLNLPETVKLNQGRGLSFHVPSAPNEVIVGP